MRFLADAGRWACVLVAAVCGLSGCRENPPALEPAKADAPREAATPAANPSAAPVAADWTELEELAPGKWAPIGAAADLEWDAESRVLKIGIGTDLNGVRWSGDIPTEPYQVELEARRLSGSDFFCGLTFPVRGATESATLIIGGWGGNLVGISSIEGLDASENSTGSQHQFEDSRWYRIRLDVANDRLQAWIDDRQVVDAHTEGQKLSLRPGPIEECAPLGLATWLTSAEFRGVRWRKTED